MTSSLTYPFDAHPAARLDFPVLLGGAGGPAVAHHRDAAGGNHIVDVLDDNAGGAHHPIGVGALLVVDQQLLRQGPGKGQAGQGNRQEHKDLQPDGAAAQADNQAGQAAGHKPHGHQAGHNGLYHSGQDGNPQPDKIYHFHRHSPFTAPGKPGDGLVLLYTVFHKSAS